jgi:hypothetical protein
MFIVSLDRRATVESVRLEVSGICGAIVDGIFEAVKNIGRLLVGL